jgi:hypothetical protein
VDKEPHMSEIDKRDLWDKHNRDEAQARAGQQASAGPTHKPVPVEQYSSQATPPRRSDATLDATDLADEYERAVAVEREAWQRARSQIPYPEGTAQSAWNEWRDAQERVQGTARRLINHVNARRADSPVDESDPRTE